MKISNIYADAAPRRQVSYRIVTATVIALAIVFTSAHAQAPPPTKTFDYDKYEEQKTACKLYDQAILNCTQNKMCDQTIIDMLRRRCSAMR
jgi:hypothetical protein